MPLNSLDHFLVRSADVDATRDFYRDALGLTEGDRPNFSFKGYWMYLGDKPVVHLAEADQNSEDTGAVDHIAFGATGIREMVTHLQDIGVALRHRIVPGGKLQQLFVHDPNGVMIELNYPGDEDAGIPSED